VIVEDPDGAPANAFRLIRTNLEFVSLGAAHRTIMMVSALKEEGKSLTIANLGLAQTTSPSPLRAAQQVRRLDSACRPGRHRRRGARAPPHKLSA